jgi:uncharacterized protein (TIGR00730 family)
MKICVFCSSNNLDEKYERPAKVLAKLLAKAGHDLVYGGSDYGLMKVMADGMQESGAKVLGVTIPVYSAHARKSVDEMIIAKTLGERKATMLERSDAVVTLVGGVGTLDELTELIELKRQTHHDKLIIVLNTDGFYDGLHMQLQRIAQEKLLKAGENAHIPIPTIDGLVKFVTEPQEVMDILGVSTDKSEPVIQVVENELS